MNNSSDNNRFEQRLRFIASRYRQEALDTDKAWQRFAEQQGVRRVLPWRRYVAATAAVLLMVVGIGITFQMKRNRPDWVAIVTGPGEVKELWLPDSTQVTLAGETTIRYDRKIYGKEKRAVQMNGKAFFQVQRDEARPFSVQTARTEVTVLGTVFQIHEMPASTSLIVTEGRVRFAAGEHVEPIILTAGMSAVYWTGTDTILRVEKTEFNTLAWKTRQLRFRETPLTQVISDLNEAYGMKIVNRPAKKNLQLTAYFDNLPLEEVILIINETLDIQLEVLPAP